MLFFEHKIMEYLEKCLVLIYREYDKVHGHENDVMIFSGIESLCKLRLRQVQVKFMNS